MQRQKKTILSLGILTIIILIFFFPYLSGHTLFFSTDEASSDILDFNFPQRVYLATQLKNHTIPLWTPYQTNGFPFLAEAQSGVFYPINVLFFSILDPALAFNYSIITAFLLVSYGTFFFLKSIKLNTTAALYGGLVIAFSGFFIGHLKHVPLIESAAFLPWMLLCTEKIITTQKKKYSILLAISIACSILAGHLPTAYSILLFTLLYFLLRYHQAFKNTTESFRPIALFFFSLAIGIFLCAVQLIPTIEMIPYSTRTAPVSTDITQIPLDQFLTFINPFQFGDPANGTYDSNRPSFWEYIGYIGLIPLILALSAFFLKISNKFIFLLLFFLSLMFVFAIPNTFSQFLWNFIPGLTFTRVSARFLLLTDFFLIVLATLAVDKLVKKRFSDKNVIIATIFLFTLADLFWNFSTYNGKVPSNEWLKPPQSVAFLKQDPSYFRITTLNQQPAYNLITQKASGWKNDTRYYSQGSKELLPTPLNNLYGIKSIHYQYEYAGAFSLAKRAQLSALTQGDGIKQPYAPKLLGLQNVKYILTLFPLPKEASTSFQLVFKKPTYKDLPPILVYKNTQVLPRAYTVPQAISLAEDKILPYMASETFDPAKEVVLEKPVSSFAKPMNKSAQIKLLEDKPTYISYRVKTTSPSYFVLTDSYYPGWTAAIDGKPTEILQANYAFRALFLPAGSHNVVFRYDPVSFKIGLMISSIAAIILLFFAYGNKRKLHKINK